MKRTLGGMPVFIVMIAILIGILQLVNWIPSAVQEGAFEKFGSLEEVRSRLKISPVLAPVYYPRDIRWPPSLIAAQTRPYPAVLLEFLRSDSDETWLVVTQTERGHRPLAEKIRLTDVREKISYPLKGRTALLEVGTCRGSERCSRISWEEGAYDVAVAMPSPPVEIIRIAESMVHAGGTATGP